MIKEFTKIIEEWRILKGKIYVLNGRICDQKEDEKKFIY